MNKRLRKKKLKSIYAIELQLEKILDYELFENKEYDERLKEWAKSIVEKVEKLENE